jgi:hypothetical protein
LPEFAKIEAAIGVDLATRAEAARSQHRPAHHVPGGRRTRAAVRSRLFRSGLLDACAYWRPSTTSEGFRSNTSPDSPRLTCPADQECEAHRSRRPSRSPFFVSVIWTGRGTVPSHLSAA